MDRVAAMAYAHGEFSELADELGLAALDEDAPRGGWATQIDQALRALGFAESDVPTATVADPDRAAYLALIDFYCLRRLSRLAAPRVDLRGARDVGLAKTRSQLFDHLQKLLANAETTLVRLGIGPIAEMTPARFTLDYLAPGGVG